MCAGSQPYSVINIDTVAITSSISWSETEEHSKWYCLLAYLLSLHLTTHSTKKGHLNWS